MPNDSTSIKYIAMKTLKEKRMKRDFIKLNVP